MYECPNLFRLPVDGNKANMRWVTWGSSTEYLIGKFNGRTFVPDDNRRLRTNFGEFSASQVFANAPLGRIVQIGWAHCGGTDGEFLYMAAFPLDLTLRTTPEGLRLCADFIPELTKLRKEGSRQTDVVVKADAPLKVGDISQPVEIIAEIDPGSASQITLTGPELEISLEREESAAQGQGSEGKTGLREVEWIWAGRQDCQVDSEARPHDLAHLAGYYPRSRSSPMPGIT